MTAIDPPFVSRYYGLNWGSRTPIAPGAIPVAPDPLTIVHEDADDDAIDPPVHSLWHGGPTVRGDMLRPPLDTGQCRSGEPDGWVYVTPIRALAATYAATCRGWVYEVAPIGPVEPDPGSILPPGQSLRCSAARILRRFRLSRAECDRMAMVVRMIERGQRPGPPMTRPGAHLFGTVAGRGTTAPGRPARDVRGDDRGAAGRGRGPAGDCDVAGCGDGSGCDRPSAQRRRCTDAVGSWPVVAGDGDPA